MRVMAEEKKPRWLKGLLLRVPLIVSGRLSPEPCISAFLFASKIVKLARKSGLLFVVQYLKQCGSCLRQYVGGVKRPAEKLPVFVSLLRSGIPRIIPEYHRRVIARGDERSHQVVRWYLSWFTLSMLICLAPGQEHFRVS